MLFRMFPQSMLASIAGAMLLPLALARRSNEPKVSYGEGANFGPYGVALSKYNEILNAPNATSQYTISGPNISAPYPGSGPVDGWSLTVSVVADIAMSESNSSTAHWYPNQIFTGSRVVLQTPKGPSSAAHESWYLCVINWDIGLAKYPSKLREDDGSCSSVLSEQCIRDVEARALEEYRLGFNPITPCGCPMLSDIPSCDGEQATALISGGGCMARSFNATMIRDWPDGKIDVRRFGGPPHDAGNLTAYNETGSLAWPVAIMWGPSFNTTWRDESGQLDLSGAGAKLSCVRAKDATPGSTAPGSITVSAGNRGAVLSSAILVGGVLLAAGWVALL